MTEITYIDPDNGATEHKDVVRFIEAWHRTTEPDANLKVFAHRKFNPHEPLEWSMIITSPRGRKHITIDQRSYGGNVHFSYD